MTDASGQSSRSNRLWALWAPVVWLLRWPHRFLVGSKPESTGPSSLHEAAWPDMFANLQSAYAELTHTESKLERRAAELEEARDLFQQVIESMSESLFLLDLTGKVVRANRAAGELLGSDSKTLVGRRFGDLCGNSDIPTTPWALQERLRSGNPLTNLDVDIRPQGSRAVPVSISCGQVRDKRGKVTGVLIVARDITERKLAEDELARQAEELERSNADLNEFARVAAHDLRAPPRTVRMYVDRLEKRLKELFSQEPDATIDNSIQRICNAVELMDQLIRDLEALSQVEGRRGKVAMVDCQLVFDKACTILQATIEESEALVTSDRLPAVTAVETDIIRLFENLVANALKYHTRERRIEIHASARRRTETEDWLFSVHDNGIGIEPEYREKIFGAGQDSRLHSRRKYPGTGFGLFTCKTIVERHGGKIWVEPKLDEGSTFFFTLPDESLPEA